MSVILAISNQKGGVGKTTTTINIGTYLSKLGKRVLLIDLDPQGNLSRSYNAINYENSIYSLLLGESNLDNTIIEVNKNYSGLSIIPCSHHFSRFEKIRAGELNAQFDLKKSISPINNDYDFILLDCPPSLGLITINAFCFTDFVLIPMEAQLFSVDGLDSMCEVIRQVKAFSNPGLSIAGIFFVRHNKRRILSQEVEEYISNKYDNLLLSSNIRENISLKESPHKCQDIFTYAPLSNSAQDYESLTNEILLKVNKNE
uniref:ParA family protein n=1 Tax=Cardinium endosymbiont of Bemisia tabaci TaxID=672794 RepID=UPI000442CFEB|nr:ParA family protein [Cardinium endosymbiont of Bemisia tabaci]CDG50367.1 Chromosome partitioning protein ParA [Cardinium endosymbiont cBtQ1 of Bemisia tabaci]